uniref:Variant surface glycoprotein 1035 n=1 Tax=Trypanosoma brucei TaxID=5691 RepID=M4SZ63_9TRYP|nr:variant surface glycoprotein 1035 [Trypanosoma brucei]
MLPTVTLTLIAAALVTGDPKVLHSTTLAICEPCQAGDYLNNIKFALKPKLSSGQMALKAMQKAKAQIWLAAAAATGEEAKKYAVLCATIAVYTDEKQKAYNAAVLSAASGMAAAAALSFSQEVIQDIKEAATADIAPTAKSTVVTSGFKAITPQLTVTAEGGCFSGKSRKPNPAGQSRKIEDELEIKLHHLEAETQAGGSTGANVLCETGSAPGSITTCLRSWSTGTNIQYRGGKILKTKGITYQRKLSANGDYAPKQDTPTNISPPTKRVKELLAQIKEAESEVNNLDISFSTETTLFLTKTQTFQQLATAIFVPESKPGEESKHGQSLRPIITANYGNNDNELKGKIWDQVKLISVKGAAQGARNPACVKKVGELTKIEQAVGFYIAQAASTATAIHLNGTSCKTAEQAKADAAEKTDEKKDGSKKATTGDCKATEEGKCDKIKCDWNKEKNVCKVKEGEFVISYVMKELFFLRLFFYYEKFVIRFAEFYEILILYKIY